MSTATAMPTGRSFPLPGATTAASFGRIPGLPSAEGGDTPEAADGDDVWAASAGLDRAEQPRRSDHPLVDDMLAGRIHETTLASTRGTMEFVTALYASALLGKPSAGRI